MIDNLYGYPIFFIIGPEDRALLKSNPSAGSDAEAGRACLANFGIRPTSLSNRDLLWPLKRKTLGVENTPQQSFSPSNLSTAGTFVTIYRAVVRGDA